MAKLLDCTGFPLPFEIRGTFGPVPYFCTLNISLHIGDLIIFGGKHQILGVKNPLQRVNGNADCKNDSWSK